jgi:hypothetical protein
MSLYSFLHKDTLVYDKINHFINDPHFIALMEAYKQSDTYETLDDLYFSSSTNTTRIKLTPSKLTILVVPKTNKSHTIIGYPDVHSPIATVNIKKNKLTFVEPNFHYIIDRTLNNLKEILYQGQ